jgi:hypothetical protein
MSDDLDEFLDAIRGAGDDAKAEMLAKQMCLVLTGERLANAALAVAMITVALAVAGSKRGRDEDEDTATVLAGIASIATDMARIVRAGAAE